MSAVDRSADGEPGTESDDRQTPEGRPPGSELRSDESRWLRYDHTRRADIDRWDRDTPPRHENEERSADDVRTRVGYERDRVIIRLDPNGRIVRAEVSGTVGQADAPGYITPESRSEAFEKQTSNRPRRTDGESAGPRWLRNDAGKLILDRDGNPIDKRSIGSTVSEQRQARHVLDTPQHRGGGYFRAREDAQRVLDAFHNGEAEILGLTRGGHIKVRVSGVEGYNNNPAAGYHDQPTDIFMIKGSSRPSVVPISPEVTP